MSLSSPENYDFQEVFLSKSSSRLRGKQCARYSSFIHIWFPSKRYMCFFNLAAQAVLEQRKHSSPWKNTICRKYSFKQ
jgi:hypothetical protein